MVGILIGLGCECCGDGGLCTFGKLLCFETTAGFMLRSNSLHLLYLHVYSICLMVHVVDGIRGLEMSPLGEFESTQTRTLLSSIVGRFNVFIVRLQHLDISKAGVFAYMVILEALVWCV